MSFERELDFKVGNGFFRRVWVSSPASTKSADGLGPILNARSCQGCHLKDGRGHTPSGNWPEDNAVSMFLRLSIPPQNEKQRSLVDNHIVKVIPSPKYLGSNFLKFVTLPVFLLIFLILEVPHPPVLSKKCLF